MKRIFILLIISLTAAPACGAAPTRDIPIRIQAFLSTNKAYVGDSLSGRISVISGKHTHISIASFPENTPDFEILKIQKSSWTLFGRTHTNLDFKLTPLKSGSFKIPSVAIHTKPTSQATGGVYQTPEMPFEVQSMLEKNDSERHMRGIKGPWLPLDRRIFFTTLAAVLLGFFFWLRGRRKEPAKPADIRLPAHVIALQKIRELERLDLPGRGLIKEFFIEISLIIRHYLEDRFLLRAPEMTSEEFLQNLKETDVLSSGQKSALRIFLLACDKVKFAKYEPPTGEIDNVLRTAKELIEETRSQDPDSEVKP